MCKLEVATSRLDVDFFVFRDVIHNYVDLGHSRIVAHMGAQGAPFCQVLSRDLGRAVSGRSSNT